MGALESLLARFGGNRFVQAAVLLAFFSLLALATGRLLALAVRRLAGRTRNELDDRVLELLRRPARASVLLAGLALVTLRVDPSSLRRNGALDLTRLTLDLLATVAILLWTSTGLRLAATLLDPARDGHRLLHRRALPLFRNLANILVVAAASYFVLVTWGIDVTAWLASAGIVGLAVGFAAKDTLANLFAGVFILTDAPYKVGDFINLESGERGEVTQVGIRSTRMITRDDVEVTIPNSVIAEARIVNESGGRWTRERLRIRVPVVPDVDLDEVRAALVAIAAAEPDVCREPAPRVRLRGFGELGLNLELLAWIEQPADRGRVSDALYSAIYKRFAGDGPEIAFLKREPRPAGARPGGLARAR